jgi:hypothetical protein
MIEQIEPIMSELKQLHPNDRLIALSEMNLDEPVEFRIREGLGLVA